MRMQKTLVVAALAGCAGFAVAGPEGQLVRLQKAKGVKTPISISTLDGRTFSNGSNSSRDPVVAYDNSTCDQCEFGVNITYARGGAMNGPDGFSSESLFVFGGAVNPGAPFGLDSEAPTDVFDNGTPTNPNDDITFHTDAIFDDYAADPSLYGNLDAIQLATQVIFNAAHINTAVDDNATPTNPNDDFPVARTNNTVWFFWGVDDNATPTNPNDDFIFFADGFNSNFNFGAGAVSIYTFTTDLTGLPNGGIQIPGQGIVMFDWGNTSSTGHPSADVGCYMPTTGGDADVSGTISGQARGIDNILIPPSQTMIDTGVNETLATGTTPGGLDPFGAAPWFWASTDLVDVSADGNPSDTTYNDVLLGPFGVWWTFQADTGVGAHLMELNNSISMSLTFELTAGCAADLTGSSDPNDPSYGVPDGDADADDFFYYLDQFVGGNLAESDLTGSSDPNDPSYGVPDGDADADDFFFYLDLFVVGCP